MDEGVFDGKFVCVEYVFARDYLVFKVPVPGSGAGVGGTVTVLPGAEHECRLREER